MFPTVRASVSGLEAAQHYFVLLDIVLAEDNRYKYTGKEWTVAGKAEPQLPARQVSSIIITSWIIIMNITTVIRPEDGDLGVKEVSLTLKYFRPPSSLK